MAGGVGCFCSVLEAISGGLGGGMEMPCDVAVGADLIRGRLVDAASPNCRCLVGGDRPLPEWVLTGFFA